MNTHMHITQILNNLKLLPENESAVSGKLVPKPEILTDASGVIAKFRAFGGEGWLCSTDSVEIRRFSPGVPLPVILPGAWPISGEAVKGDESLHLTRSADGWHLTTLRRELDTTTEGVLISSTLLARNGGDFHYETAWAHVNVAGQKELRPYAFRFLGFTTK